MCMRSTSLDNQRVMGPASPEVSPHSEPQAQAAAASNNNNNSAVEVSASSGGAFQGYDSLGGSGGYPGSLGSPSTPTPRPSSATGQIENFEFLSLITLLLQHCTKMFILNFEKRKQIYFPVGSLS